MDQPGLGAPPPYRPGPEPSGPPRRFGGGGIALGLLIGAVAVPLLAGSAVVGTANATGSPAATVTLGALAGLALPVGLGIIGLRQADPGRRGFGLGVVLGCLLSTVVVVGVGTLIAVYVIRHAPG